MSRPTILLAFSVAILMASAALCWRGATDLALAAVMRDDAEAVMVDAQLVLREAHQIQKECQKAMAAN
jgi:hypothetical protein